MTSPAISKVNDVDVDLSAFDPATAAKIQARMDVLRWITHELDVAIGGRGDFTVSAKLARQSMPNSVEELAQAQIDRRTRFSPQTLSAHIVDGLIDPDRCLWRPGATGWKSVHEALPLPVSRYVEAIEKAVPDVFVLTAIARESDHARWTRPVTPVSAATSAKQAEDMGDEPDEPRSESMRQR
jgi:hypothetical protein